MKIRKMLMVSIFTALLAVGVAAKTGPAQDIPAPCGQDGLPACTSCSDCDSMPWWARWACYLQCV